MFCVVQEAGHLSYKCPSNLLGEREPPPKKKKLKKGQKNADGDDGERSVYLLLLVDFGLDF